MSDSHRRRSKKDPDRERSTPRPKDKDRDRDRERHKSSRSRKTHSSASKEDDEHAPSRRQSTERVRNSTSTSTLTSSQASRSSHKMAVVPEMGRRGSLGSENTSRISLPYPSHSKTYAKESIYSRDGVEKRKSTSTPDATDGEASPGRDDERPAAPQPPNRAPPPPPPRAPPSPPLTATTGADLRKAASANSMRRKDPDMIAREMEDGRQSVDSGTRMTSTAGPRLASRSSIRDEDTFDGTDLTSTTGSQPSTIRAKSPPPTTRTRTVSPSNVRPPGRTSTPSRTSTPGRTSTPVKMKTRAPSEYTLDSEATSVLQDRNSHYRRSQSPPRSDVSPSSINDSSPRTPTQHSLLPSNVSSVKDGPPVIEVMTDPMSRAQSVDPSYAQSPMTPPPPPPPPAMMEAPRVDYLLQNGGLTKAIPRSLLAAIDGVPASAYSQYTTPRLSGAQAHDVRSFFKPLQNVLNSYNTVMDTSGSLAVATGYRSIARRLLDRLENVFARNISSEHCACMMCFDEQSVVEDSAGVNWGEILELVSGRCELPTWPPYEEGPGSGLGISSDLEAPCQRIDVDVPEQYREHYEKQSKKTKVAVQSWLSDQQDGVPEDADDETLTFIMLTRLEQPQRPLFYALLWGLEKLPNPRTQKPDSGTPPYLAKAGLALQRLYRLYTPPRDQLVVMYLIRHADMHNMLATLAAVTKHEWEILVSGRFDGFLWSGVEDMPDMNTTPPRTGSRAGRPMDGPQRFASPVPPNRYGGFSPSPYSRPGSARPGSVRPPGGAPVQMDEETEIAVLAEIEREIYLGMEAMEDAFEQLHNQAEGVRRRLRERAAALSMVAQQRRGAGIGGIEVRIDTPANMRDPDEGVDDLRSEIGPDDSASNVSNNRRRKAHRARERRTPAPVEEESEEDVALAERIRRRF